MKIVFMGTPDFAVPSLLALHAAGHEIVACITREDAPKGRKMILTPPPVKVAAMELGIPVYQPKTLRDDAFASLLSELDPELIAVVAFGKLLPENVLNYPKYGCINVHGSLLPEYRGAAPMQRAIMDGKTVTGITTMFMDIGMDTGDMLLTAEHNIGENETYGEMAVTLAEIGAELLVKTVELAKEGKLVRTVQDHSKATHAEKIDRAEEELDFSLEASALHNKVRALSPAPMCRAYTPNGSLLKIAKTLVSDIKTSAPAGSVIEADKKLIVACGNGTALEICELVPEGKQKMNAADYLRGRKLFCGDMLRGKKE
ncbi:MAG: methionyl-tRNA formyltransferase [Clostridia bacterium]|nr:methionyl-tRNA formyltransferase [Clostridia bacterium]